MGAHSSGDSRAEEESLEVDGRERKCEEGSEPQRDQLVCKKHHIPLNPRIPVDPTGCQVSWGAFPHRSPQRLPDTRQCRESLQQTNRNIIEKAGASRPNGATLVSAKF